MKLSELKKIVADGFSAVKAQDEGTCDGTTDNISFTIVRVN